MSDVCRIEVLVGELDKRLALLNSLVEIGSEMSVAADHGHYDASLYARWDEVKKEYHLRSHLYGKSAIISECLLHEVRQLAQEHETSKGHQK